LQERHAMQLETLQTQHARQLAAAGGGGGGVEEDEEVGGEESGGEEEDEERQRRRLAAAAAAEEARFGRTQRDTHAQLADLAANIDEKSRLMDELAANEAHATQLNAQVRPWRGAGDLGYRGVRGVVGLGYRLTV
jgi:hypothetical protein